MGVIKYQKKEQMVLEELENGIKRVEMLPGMVEGVFTYKCQVSAGTIVELETFGDKTQIYYFTKGEGFVVTPKKAFNIEEPSLFIPNMDLEKNELHAVTDMEFLQLVCTMLPEDKERFEKWHISLPRFNPISNCIQYIEGFRPEGIKAYSILDTDFLTRMTMGAIIGKGPNAAEPHSHDNLYQWYYGMPGTKFIYRAAGEEIELTEGDWAFIPTNIEHAIEIKENENVNYVWFEIEVSKEEKEEK
jgi:mannose-6-phosphate isomerase-like protein (cupin superfamily)